MAEVHQETRGRKPLVDGEPTVTKGVCLPESLFDRIYEAAQLTPIERRHHSAIIWCLPPR